MEYSVYAVLIRPSRVAEIILAVYSDKKPRMIYDIARIVFCFARCISGNYSRFIQQILQAARISRAYRLTVAERAVSSLVIIIENVCNGIDKPVVNNHFSLIFAHRRGYAFKQFCGGSIDFLFLFFEFFARKEIVRVDIADINCTVLNGIGITVRPLKPPKFRAIVDNARKNNIEKFVGSQTVRREINGFFAVCKRFIESVICRFVLIGDMVVNIVLIFCYRGQRAVFDINKSFFAAYLGSVKCHIVRRHPERNFSYRKRNIRHRVRREKRRIGTYIGRFIDYRSVFCRHFTVRIVNGLSYGFSVKSNFEARFRISHGIKS